MTTDNDKHTDPGKGGQGQRPHVTLDLEAKEVTADASPPPSAEAATSGAERPPAPLRELRGFVTHLAAGLLGGLAALVLGYYGVEQFRDRLPLLTERAAGDMRSAVAGLEEQLTALRARIDARAPQLAGRLGQVQTDLQALAAKTESLEQQLARVDRDLAAARSNQAATPEEALRASIAARLDPIDRRVAALETAVDGLAKAEGVRRDDARATALAIALTNLRRALAVGRPFAAELTAVTDLSPVSLDVSALAPWQDSGIATLAALQDGFAAEAGRALRAERPPADSLVDRVLSAARSAVRIRRTGDVAGTSADAVLARMESRLETGDLAAAVQEADHLAGAPAAVMKPWLDGARARIAADQTLARIEARLLAALGDRVQGTR